MERRIIQLITIGKEQKLAALCNDGTVFAYDYGTWKNIPNVPQNIEVSNSVSTPIDDLELSIRSLNCLKSEGIETIEQLMEWPITRLSKIQNLGRRSLCEIQEALAVIGLRLNKW